MASQIIERAAYAGKYDIKHNPNARGRAPRYLVSGSGLQDHKPEGVTTILGKTVAKDLMQWAVDCYTDYLRTKMPVITEKDLEIGAAEYIRLRDAGGSSGTIAHAMAEALLKGEAIPTTANVGALAAFKGFADWLATGDNVEILNVEQVVYSAEHDYAGTYDLMIKLDGKVVLADLKTTNPSKAAPAGVYAENFLQLGGYAGAHLEERQHDPSFIAIDDLAIISAKKNGIVDVVLASELGISVGDAVRGFNGVVKLHRFLRDTKVKLGGK